MIENDRDNTRNDMGRATRAKGTGTLDEATSHA